MLASSREAAAVVVRNTPQLAWLARLLPAPRLLRSIDPTPGDASQSGALYVPNGEGRWPGVLLVNGAEVPGGWRYPDIERFAMSIADLGMTVYVPDLPGFEQGALSLRALEALERDLAWFSQSEHVSGGQASLVGVCVGASLGIVAAADPEAQGRVHSLVAIDPYARLRDVLQAATVAMAPGLDGQSAPFEMEPWVRADLVRSLASTVTDEASRADLLEALAGAPSGDPLQAFRRPPPAELSASGAAWWRLLGNTDPAAFDHLWDDLPTSMRAEMDSLSPAGREAQVQAPLLVAAPYHDFAFPAGEATVLQQANPARVKLTRTSALDHVTPTLGLSVVRDYWQLWRFTGDAIHALR